MFIMNRAQYGHEMLPVTALSLCSFRNVSETKYHIHTQQQKEL
jgi:hypothetical protein